MESTLSNPHIEYADNAWIAQTMILGGVGLAIMPHFAVQQSDQLVSIPVENLPLLSYGITWHKQNPKNIPHFIKEIAFLFDT
ncbi:hypothetical protein [Streptococcus sp. DD13]|uniref:hypothetical protein n=1 Tax=Streptococcus sp. DD13 TaxID=1777881 RepID=UPI0007937BCC|nr:hypothetical protein [Streptococcus sp. DD13]KXT77585.1 hypothetical protein STRDD13_01456 [Streptococcus sp. DD13]